MNLKKTTLSLLFLFCGVVLILAGTQQKKRGHLNTIKAPYDIELNLPQFDVAFTIPANTTFKMPVTIGDDVAMEINKTSYYSFDLKHLDEFSTRTFRFFESYQDKYPGLFLEIERYNDDMTNFVEKNHNKGDLYKYLYNSLTEAEKSVTPIVSGLGTSIVYILKDEDMSYTGYSFFRDGYSYTFYLSTEVNDSVSNSYKKIIESIVPKNLFQKRKEYENRAKYNYYKLEKHPKLPSDKKLKFDYYRGKTTRDNLSVNPLFGTEIKIPAGTEYMIQANHVVETGTDSLLVYVDRNDYINNKQCVENYYLKNFNLAFFSAMNITDIGAYAKQLSGNYPVFKSVESMIGQTPLHIYYYGGKDQGTLALFIKTGEYSLSSLYIYGYSQKTKEAVHSMLSTFRWNGASLPDLTYAIELEKGDDVVFSDIQLPDPDLENASKWEMMDLGLKFRLPGQISEYTVTRMQKTAKMSPSGIFIKAKPKDQSGMTILNTDKPVMLYIGLADKPDDMAEALRDQVRAWGAYVTVDAASIEANVLSYGDIQWNVMIYKLGENYYATATTFTEGCHVALYVNNVKNKQEIFDNLAYIKTFEQKEPLRR